MTPLSRAFLSTAIISSMKVWVAQDATRNSHANSRPRSTGPFHGSLTYCVSASRIQMASQTGCVLYKSMWL